MVLLTVVVAAFCQQGTATENVFIVTLDGFRWQELYNGADSLLITNKTYVRDADDLKKDFWADTPEKRREMLMPFFWSVIARKGQLYGNRKYDNNVNCSNNMWFSYPGYNEILCGFADDERINSNDKIENPNVTVLEFLNKQQKFKGKVAAFGSWDVFPYIINEKRSGVPVNAGYESASDKSLSQREIFMNELQPQTPNLFGGVRLDAFTHHYAVEYIRKHQPKVVYIAYGETDDFAHDGRYDCYLRSALQTDKFIKELWDLVQSSSTYKDKTTFIITTDHGRGTEPLDTWRSHSTKIAGADQIWFAVIGPDTTPMGEIKVPAQFYQNQVAKTAAAFLKVPYKSEKPVGETIVSMIRN